MAVNTGASLGCAHTRGVSATAEQAGQLLRKPPPETFSTCIFRLLRTTLGKSTLLDKGPASLADQIKLRLREPRLGVRCGVESGRSHLKSEAALVNNRNASTITPVLTCLGQGYDEGATYMFPCKPSHLRLVPSILQLFITHSKRNRLRRQILASSGLLCRQDEVGETRRVRVNQVVLSFSSAQ